ncbi:MAG: hypothetical protein COV76_05015 [Candidatus Omnitrophica bacterium CG11_big_fil_rev_8_21_14_0_20_64_10]|nr:MAG: hypothetical protein COV76_05015 [Candidatus Omnitrophica bacterium CG11_big_fil_rev_8_21_14_0_20_64_10]
MSTPAETLKLCRGQTLDLSELLTDLVGRGYHRVPKVSDPGELSVRGGVLDIFPEGFEAPVRIELDGNTLHRLRSVHPQTGVPFLDHEVLLVLPTQRLARRALRQSVKHIFLDESAPIDPFVDIRVGDFVVHVGHGIGRYLGLKKVRSPEGVREQVVLEYAGGDRLTVSLDELHLIQKYIGFEGRPPKLSRLGTRYWDRTKAWARRGARTVAAELLNLQARRASRAGFAFPPDSDWQRKLEADFPYPETAGQVRAVAEVKQDMEAPRPMDRLLCGDVGYGKTEVALRAAFKAVSGGRQVALLCPTTILAEQHAATFSKRMASFPVAVEMLSRFQTKSRQAEILKRLAAGQVDILIGTHRLLSGDVRFRELGLLILDEEQRFGVRHKEHFKRLRAEVDVLTLTATPIPRTLYQALMGAKAMSLIDTPPFERLPVRTQVLEAADAPVQQALARELKRGGQAFVIHPWIEGIEKVAGLIRRLVPSARVVVAHGQMPPHALEQGMLAFMRHAADILVSTAIVESGIDIPNANTMVVFRADSFGLADLYQLRGRVGRFTRQAHCLFLTPPKTPPTGEARKRLKAVEEFSSLGAGFQIALQDLQLRGAGNLLGTEQHGHIAAVGFDLYCRLLKGEIERLRRSPALIQ